jgi:hypothetical protein
MYAFDVTEDTESPVESRKLQVRLTVARLYYILPIAPRPQPTAQEIFKDNFERLKASVAAQNL